MRRSGDGTSAAEAAARAKAAARPRRTKPPRPVVWVCTLLARRQRLGLSQDDVGAGAGISGAAVSEIERGAGVTLVTARRLAKFFGCTVDELWPRLADDTTT